MMKTIKKLCIFAGLAGITGCFTPVRTVPVITTPTVVAPATSTIIYDTTPIYMDVWGFGPRRLHRWGPGPHHPHFHGRHR